MSKTGSVDEKEKKSPMQGPSGFIQLGDQALVVDYGKVYAPDGNAVGFFFEDGYLQKAGANQSRIIEEIEGCVFRGIDNSGMELTLPNGGGPTGTLKFNGLVFNVINGRIATEDHYLIGEFDDDGTVFLRDRRNKVPRRKLDENSLLNTHFEGTKSNGKKFNHEFLRPLTRKDKTYSENEIIRYFEEFDKLTTPQKKYVQETLKLWSSSGLLQVIRKSEGNAAVTAGNVRHGAAGVTGVRTGQVTLDREEFEKDITLYRDWGAMAVLTTRVRNLTEVRINLVVSHEFGHQLEFVLSAATQKKIEDMYEARLKLANKLNPLPNDYDGRSEILPKEKVQDRTFISGYARTSYHEYWAECVAAFSVKASREVLKKLDPGAYELLCDCVFKPETVLRPNLRDPILDLQASLRTGGELGDDLLDKTP